MAYKDFGSLDFGQIGAHSSQTLQIDGSSVQLPDASFVRDAEMSRDGVDLVLDGPQGHIVIEGYFAADPAPLLHAPGGATLTPELVDSFMKTPAEYAANQTMTDASPVGEVSEVSGEATVTRVDGSVEKLTVGSPIFEGDIIETTNGSAVNITFIDETSFAISEDARLAIDEYVFDPSTQSGTQNFSVLKGLFVFTSGLIGRDDPDDVQIDTPAGSIGIRGTIIAGDATTGEITVVEGAIVLRDLMGNEMTLADRFETARFSADDGIENMGQLDADDMADKFSTISDVSPSLFSSIQDAGQEPGNSGDGNGTQDAPSLPPLPDPSGSNGLQGDQGGLAPPPSGSGTGSSSTGTTGSGSTSGSSSSSSLSSGGEPPPAGGEPPPPPPPVAPPPTINLAPEYRGVAATHPVFSGAEGIVWEYSFGKSFYDPDGPQTGLTFSLSQDAIAVLGDLRDLGLLNTSLNPNGYSIDATTGLLQIFFSNSFVSIGYGFDLSVIARDGGGQTHQFDFTLNAYNADNILTGDQGGSIMISNNDNEVWSITDDATNYSQIQIIGVNENRVFVEGSGMDRNIQVVSGNNNFIHLTDGNNTVGIVAGNIGTTVVGGIGNELFQIGELTQTRLFGMEGADVFLLNNTGVIADLMSGNNLILDGGIEGATGMKDILQDLRDGVTPVSTGLPLGDMLKINIGVAGTLDFRAIAAAGNQIHGMEALNLTNSASNTVILSQQNILDITGPDNILLINFESTDTVQIENWGSDDFVQMNNEADGGVDINGVRYDVWHNSESGVTLFIQQNAGGGDAGTVTAIP